MQSLPPLTFFQSDFSKLFVTQGRARRSEFWWFQLVALPLSFLTDALLIGVGAQLFTDNIIALYLTAVFSPIVLLLPQVAIVTRRLHDVGKSGWVFFIASLAYVFIVNVVAIQMVSQLSFLAYGVWLFVLFVTDSQKGANRYGKSPKYAAA